MATVLQVSGMQSSTDCEAIEFENLETMATGRDTDPSLPGQEYDPSTFTKEMERLDNMQKTLQEVKQKLHQANMQSLLLNADIVTMFDPVSTDELKKVVMECTKCADRIEHMQQRDMEELRGES